MGSSSSYFTGDCKALDQLLTRGHGPVWGLLKYFNALFRGVGQVVFANNPWSGFIILASLYWASLLVGFATTVAATTAILTAIIFKQDDSLISSGLTTYNAVLVGSVTASLWEPTYGEPIDITLWGFIVLCAALSVLVNVALGNILGSFKPTLPSFTLAFNIVTILLFTDLQPRTTTTGRGVINPEIVGQVQSIQQENNSSLLRTFFKFPKSTWNARIKMPNGTGVDILSVIEGIMLSMGQVYAVQNLEGSIAMYLATFLYSPIVCIMSIVGATVGSFFGIVFAGPTYETVYTGIWGFNAILASIAVGAFYYVPSTLSFAASLADVSLVVLIQMALTIAFAPFNLPFLTFPFVISTIFLLEITATGDILTRVTNFSYPEQHLKEFYQKKQMEAQMTMEMIGGTNSSTSKASAPVLPIYHSATHLTSYDYHNQDKHHHPFKSQNHYFEEMNNDYPTQPPNNPAFYAHAENQSIEHPVNHHQTLYKSIYPYHVGHPQSMGPNSTLYANATQEYALKRR